MKNTSIEWADNTINFYVGCTKVSEGCKNCYMFRLEERWGRNPNIVRKTKWETIERNLRKWKPSRIFVNSMSDTFHESLTHDDITDMFKIMVAYPQHQYLILTKRIQRAYEYFRVMRHYMNDNKFLKLPDNFWIGTSIESENTKKRLQFLGLINAKIRFVSFEPLLGYVNIEPVNCFEWAIVGGESGYKPRPTREEWFEDLIEQLKNMEIPIFFKQWGGTSKCKCHGAWGCRLWNGETLDETPE